MAIEIYECPHCHDRLALRFGTDGNGRLVESRDPCSCERGKLGPADTPEERQRRRQLGICVDCGAPVRGKVGQSLRCEPCHRAARREAGRKYQKTTGTARRRERRRSDPEYAARCCAATQKWRAENAERQRLTEQRRNSINHPTYAERRERQRQYDAAHRERKAARSLARYYEQNPVRPAPVCAVCSEPIPYKRGRVPKYHAECDPWKNKHRARRRKLAGGC